MKRFMLRILLHEPIWNKVIQDQSRMIDLIIEYQKQKLNWTRLIARITGVLVHWWVVAERLETTSWETSIMMWRWNCQAIQANRVKGKSKNKNRWLKVWLVGLSTLVGYLMRNPLYTYISNIYDLVWFGLVLWHINHCLLFNAKSSLYIYIKYIWFGLVWFYGISTIVGI